MVSTTLRPDADRAAILEHLAQWPADELVAQAMMAPALGSWPPGSRLGWPRDAKRLGWPGHYGRRDT